MARDRRPNYRTLDAGEIVKTVRRLSDRVGERFPETGLAGAGRQLLATAAASARRARALTRPYLGLRALLLAILLGGGAGLYNILAAIDWRGALGEGAHIGLAEPLESVVNLVVLTAAGLWFLLTLEERWKRARTHTALHELRSFAHVVDMHQLTKDPTVLLGGGPATPSSPERRMTRFELTRYLEYSAEMLALTGKLAALYAGETHDHVIIAAAGDVESLCTDLGRKIWQKITILGELQED